MKSIHQLRHVVYWPSVAFLLPLSSFSEWMVLKGAGRERKEETSWALVPLGVSLASPLIYKISDCLFVFFWLTTDGAPSDRLAPTGQLPLFFSCIQFPSRFIDFIESEKWQKQKNSSAALEMDSIRLSAVFSLLFYFLSFRSISRRRKDNRCQDQKRWGWRRWRNGATSTWTITLVPYNCIRSYFCAKSHLDRLSLENLLP